MNRVLERDWTKLQAPLEIPQYLMLDIMNQKTVLQQVFRYILVTSEHVHTQILARLWDEHRHTSSIMHDA